MKIGRETQHWISISRFVSLTYATCQFWYYMPASARGGMVALFILGWGLNIVLEILIRFNLKQTGHEPYKPTPGHCQQLK